MFFKLSLARNPNTAISLNFHTMPNVFTSLEYLQNLPLYEKEKPYWFMQGPRDDFDPDQERLDNLEFESRENIEITDIRPFKDSIQLENYGFEVLSHTSRISEFLSVEDAQEYKSETERMLRDVFNASFVKCYDFILRKNVLFNRTQFDLNDCLHTEGPARGAHNDITYNSGPAVIARNLSSEELATYTKPGYRFRIINTWRSLLPILEDRPLALCDSRSVHPFDLVEADRIIPNKVGEVYYLKYNPKHEWYWLSRQTNAEPYAFVMYDTKGGDHARFCPHVSFENPSASVGAPPRQSVETRSVVITRE